MIRNSTHFNSKVHLTQSSNVGHHNGTICHPCQRDKGKYTALGTHYAAQGLHYLPKGLQYCQRAGGPRAVLEARGQVMQPEGSIMWPMGGIFSCSRGQGWHINNITWKGRYFTTAGKGTFGCNFFNKHPRVLKHTVKLSSSWH